MPNAKQLALVVLASTRMRIIQRICWKPPKPMRALLELLQLAQRQAVEHRTVDRTPEKVEQRLQETPARNSEFPILALLIAFFGKLIVPRG